MSEKENTEPIENQQPSKKRKLSLSLKNRESRFKPVSENKLIDMSKPVVPKNTEKTDRWALANLNEWYVDYNDRNADKKCPEEVLTPQATKEALNTWLCVFVTETRGKKGDAYRPKTLQFLLSGILRYMKSRNPEYPNFMDKDDPCFRKFHVTLDNLLKSLRSDGVGAVSVATETITAEEEDQLWSSGVLNVDSPKGLLRCVFFYNGKCFCLRGGAEHRDLCISQFERLTDPDRYIYCEKSSKNRQGGLAQTRLDHKTVTITAIPSAGNRCHVFLLDKYLGKLPQLAVQKDIFYCKPYSCVPDGINSPWYYAIPVGKNVLGNMVSEMCSEGGVSGKKTNHSLRVAGTTTLYEAGVPEKIIQQRTGHRCLSSLRTYERVSSEQELAVSRILAGEEKMFNVSMETVANTSSCPPVSVNSVESSSSLSKGGPVNCNNCTVNFFSGPGAVPPIHSFNYPQPNPFGGYGSYPPTSSFCGSSMYSAGPQVPPSWPMMPPFSGANDQN